MLKVKNMDIKKVSSFHVGELKQCPKQIAEHCVQLIVFITFIYYVFIVVVFFFLFVCFFCCWFDCFNWYYSNNTIKIVAFQEMKLLQSRTKLLEKVFPIMSTFLRNKTISKTTPLRDENPFPQFNVVSYKRPGMRLSFEYTTTLLSGERGEGRIGPATMFRKLLSKYTIFSIVLSKNVARYYVPSSKRNCWYFRAAKQQRKPLSVKKSYLRCFADSQKHQVRQHPPPGVYPGYLGFLC